MRELKFNLLGPIGTIFALWLGITGRVDWLIIVLFFLTQFKIELVKKL